MTAPAQVTAILGNEEPDYCVALTARHHSWKADEPAPQGGADAGPRPFELVLAGLASCTAITLRMYVRRKQWTLGEVRVGVSLRKHGESFSIDRTVTHTGALSQEQRTKLADICERTPVTLLLKQGALIRTTVL